jgi:predicted HTH transcriptional regulator
MAIKLEDPEALLDNLRALPRETDWVEFKVNNADPIAIGKYVSALANAAILREKSEAYLVWGIENETHGVVGTTVDLHAMTQGNEPFLLWLNKMLDPRINLLVETVEYHGRNVQILCITPAYERPVRFQSQGYIRIGTAQQKLVEYPDLERSIWQITSRFSFESSIIQPNATVEDLNEHYDFSKLLVLLGITANSTEAKLDRLQNEGMIQ